MNRNLITAVVIVTATLSAPAFAGMRDDLLARYATAARTASPAFAGFSAARGKSLYSQSFNGGKPDTPSCTTCHGKDPRAAGRTPIGKTIEPVAISVSPSRYADAAKVEKWFRRNCNEVLGRECTPQEKGDWLTYVTSQ
jgi:hypothetical protein